MGKSFFIVPTASEGAISAQVGRMRRDICLKPDGPFSERGEAVDRIADQVRERAKRSGDSEVETAIISLAPQNRICDDSQRSTLDVPFILGTAPHGGWQDFPESAEAVASIRAVKFNGGGARSTGAPELTMLALSVLRRLGVECYFTLCTCSAQPHSTTTDTGAGFEGQIVPIITAPTDSGIELSSIASPSEFFSVYPVVALEVLDDDAFLSYIKLQNAFWHARTLMSDMADPGLTEAIRALRCIQIGHTLHEGMTLWTLFDAQSDLSIARNAFGERRIRGMDSFRRIVGQGIVQTMTGLKEHTMAAASAMLPEKIMQKVVAEEEASDIMRLLDTLVHPSVQPFREYVRSIPMMSAHTHPVSGCGSRKTKN